VSVTAIIVTRGDVDRHAIIESIPEEYEVLVWDNGGRVVMRKVEGSYVGEVIAKTPDLAVYGRYAAIEYATGDLIYVQDDDVLHATEGIREMVQEWNGVYAERMFDNGHVVCNMPANFRHAFYQEHALVGFGAVFHRDAPEEAFASFWTGVTLGTIPQVSTDDFNRTCDIVFTALTPRVLVDVLYEDMPWASADNRMWKQPTHREERQRMLDLVLEVRNGRP
jgi:hypothetical protein